jgi:hypothetical protein
MQTRLFMTIIAILLSMLSRCEKDSPSGINTGNATVNNSGPSANGDDAKRQIYHSIIDSWGYVSLQFLVNSKGYTIYRDSLRLALEDEDVRTRLCARFALFMIRDQPETMLAAVLESLSSSDEVERELAAYLLEYYFQSMHDPGPGRPVVDQNDPLISRPTDEEYVPMLLTYYDQHDEAFARLSIMKSFKYFCGIPGVLDVVLSATKGTNPDLRIAAAEVLQTIDPSSDCY